tara:strand:+ start:1934 stop:2128 length:195 start_codon:yes stop_codon:yes gene_type:complete
MKYWDSENNNTFTMQFGHGMSAKKNNKGYIHKRKYYYPDKRTKAYGNQRVELLKNGKTNSRIKK